MDKIEDSKNNNKIDLHNHTYASDGMQSPVVLLLRAWRAGIKVVSMTDHNNVNGYKILEEEIGYLIYTLGRKQIKEIGLLEILKEVKIITGCEVITEYEDNVIEILAYNMELKTFSKEINEIHRGFPITDDLLKQGYDKIIKKNSIKINRNSYKNATGYLITHNFFRELKRYKENTKIANQIKDEKDFVFNYIYNENTPFYIDLSDANPKLKKVIATIHKSGGLAFLAHPGHYKFDIEVYLDDIISYGIDGIEIWHPDNSRRMREILLTKAKKYNLKSSGGSDDHRVSDKYKIGNSNIEDLYGTNWIEDVIKNKKDFISNSTIIHNIMALNNYI